MSELKIKELDSEQVTMLCIQFCEVKGLLNAEMGLSTIEYIRHEKDKAVEKLKYLIDRYGNDADKKSLKEMGE